MNIRKGIWNSSGGCRTAIFGIRAGTVFCWHHLTAFCRFQKSCASSIWGAGAADGFVTFSSGEGDVATIEFAHRVKFAAQAVIRGGGQIKGNDPVPVRRQQRGLVSVVAPQLQQRHLFPPKAAACIQLRFSQPLQGGVYTAIPRSYEGLLSGVASRPATAEMLVREMGPSPAALCRSHLPLLAIRPNPLGRACTI